MRRGMAAGTEGQARVQFDMDGAVFGGGRVQARHVGVVAVPTGHDPQAFSNVDGAKLRLRQAHPVGVRHIAQRPAGKQRRVQFAGRGGLFHDLRGVGAIGQQGNDAVAVPGLNVGLGTGFAEQGAFVIGAEVGVFHGYRQHARFQQRIRQGFGLRLQAMEHEFTHDYSSIWPSGHGSRRGPIDHKRKKGP
ncbi:hypothetical protein D3C72_473250 [compost metagenome]